VCRLGRNRPRRVLLGHEAPLGQNIRRKDTRPVPQHEGPTKRRHFQGGVGGQGPLSHDRSVGVDFDPATVDSATETDTDRDTARECHSHQPLD